MSDKKRFTLQLLLDTNSSNEFLIDKRFHMLAHIHNTAVSHCKKQIRKLEADPLYKNLLSEIRLLPKKNLSDKQKRWKEQVNLAIKAMRKEYGLTQNCLEHWILPCSRQFSKHLSSHQVQKEISFVAKAVNDYFYKKDCTEIHFKSMKISQSFPQRI